MIPSSIHLALHCAATAGHCSTVRLLIEHCRCSIEGNDEENISQSR